MKSRLHKLENQDAWVQDIMRDIGAFLKRSGHSEAELAVANTIKVFKEEMRWQKISNLVRDHSVGHVEKNLARRRNKTSKQ